MRRCPVIAGAVSPFCCGGWPKRRREWCDISVRNRAMGTKKRRRVRMVTDGKGRGWTMPAAHSGDRLVLHAVQLTGADFSGRRLDDISVANGSRLTRCNFERVRIVGGGLGGGRRPSTYVECTFDGSRLRSVIPGRATFISCSFRNVHFSDILFLEAEFIECTFSGRLESIVFSVDPVEKDVELGREKNSYRDNDFSGASMVDVAFRGGIDLDKQRLPVGSDYLLIKNSDSVISCALEHVRRWRMKPTDKKRP